MLRFYFKLLCLLSFLHVWRIFPFCSLGNRLRWGVTWDKGLVPYSLSRDKGPQPRPDGLRRAGAYHQTDLLITARISLKGAVYVCDLNFLG